MSDINENAISDLLKTKALIDQIGPDAFVKNIAPNRSEIENILFSQTTIEKSELITTIKNHCSVLNNYYQTDSSKKLDLKEDQLINLVVSAFTVGYTLGSGEQAMAALPILALAGVNLELGQEIANIVEKPSA